MSFGQFQVFRQLVQHPFAVVVRIEKPTCLIGEDEGFGRRIGALLLPALKIVRETPGDMDHRQTLLGLSPRANLALVDGLNDRSVWRLHDRSTSTESEQFARTKCIGHVQLQQDPILQSQFNKSQAELIPGESRSVRIP